MNKLRDCIAQCFDIAERIRAGINTPNKIGLQQAINAYYADLLDGLEALSVFVNIVEPHISDQLYKLSVRMRNDPQFNDFDFGGVLNIVAILKKKYSCNRGRKIFICHSSKDKKIVEIFTDNILQLGIGIDPNDIFCTSIEDMKIKNGEDIRKHIHEKIKNSDFSFLLLSNAYKESEICMNEMGAVWAYDNNVRYYLLPDFKFDEIGWLCDTKSAEVLCDPTTLDSIQRELKMFYNLEDKGASWSRQRERFIATCHL